jgi:AAA ATPase domain
MEAKGKSDGVVAQRLLRALSLMRPRGVGGLRTVFVRRDTELGQLQDGYRRVVAEGRPQLAVIAGEAGVGKTRLVPELWGWLAEQEQQPHSGPAVASRTATGLRTGRLPRCCASTSSFGTTTAQTLRSDGSAGFVTSASRSASTSPRVYACSVEDCDRPCERVVAEVTSEVRAFDDSDQPALVDEEGRVHVGIAEEGAQLPDGH